MIILIPEIEILENCNIDYDFIKIKEEMLNKFPKNNMNELQLKDSLYKEKLMILIVLL